MEVIENKGADLQDFGTSVELAANLVRRMGVRFHGRPIILIHGTWIPFIAGL